MRQAFVVSSENNGEGDVAAAHRLLVGAIQAGKHGCDASHSALIEAMHCSCGY
jgi:hypothetical protein